MRCALNTEFGTIQIRDVKLVARGPNVVRDEVFFGTVRMPGFRIWSSKKCSPKEKKSFKLKLRKNSNEEMVDNCGKSRVALQVMAREIMLHFGLQHTISGYRCRER